MLSRLLLFMWSDLPYKGFCLQTMLNFLRCQGTFKKKSRFEGELFENI